MTVMAMDWKGTTGVVRVSAFLGRALKVTGESRPRITRETAGLPPTALHT